MSVPSSNLLTNRCTKLGSPQIINPMVVVRVGPGERPLFKIVAIRSARPPETLSAHETA